MKAAIFSQSAQKKWNQIHPNAQYMRLKILISDDKASQWIMSGNILGELSEKGRLISVCCIHLGKDAAEHCCRERRQNEMESVPANQKKKLSTWTVSFDGTSRHNSVTGCCMDAIHVFSRTT